MSLLHHKFQGIQQLILSLYFLVLYLLRLFHHTPMNQQVAYLLLHSRHRHDHFRLHIVMVAGGFLLFVRYPNVLLFCIIYNVLIFYKIFQWSFNCEILFKCSFTITNIFCTPSAIDIFQYILVIQRFYVFLYL